MIQIKLAVCAACALALVASGVWRSSPGDGLVAASGPLWSLIGKLYQPG